MVFICFCMSAASLWLSQNHFQRLSTKCTHHLCNIIAWWMFILVKVIVLKSGLLKPESRHRNKTSNSNYLYDIIRILSNWFCKYDFVMAWNVSDSDGSQEGNVYKFILLFSRLAAVAIWKSIYHRNCFISY